MAGRSPRGGNGRRHRRRCCPSSKPPARPRARSPAPRDAQLKSLKLEFVISCQLSPRCRVAVGVLGWDGTVGPTGLIDEVPWQRDAYHLAVGQERQIRWICAPPVASSREPWRSVAGAGTIPCEAALARWSSTTSRSTSRRGGEV